MKVADMRSWRSCNLHPVSLHRSLAPGCVYYLGRTRKLFTLVLSRVSIFTSFIQHFSSCVNVYVRVVVVVVYQINVLVRFPDILVISAWLPLSFEGFQENKLMVIVLIGSWIGLEKYIVCMNIRSSFLFIEWAIMQICKCTDIFIILRHTMCW